MLGDTLPHATAHCHRNESLKTRSLTADFAMVAAPLVLAAVADLVPQAALVSATAVASVAVVAAPVSLPLLFPVVDLGTVAVAAAAVAAVHSVSFPATWACFVP